MTNPGSPYVRDPLNPTDAELAAAITRGIETGQLLTVEEFFAAAAELGSAPAPSEPRAEPEAEP
jgi:hypothetical protein